MTHSLLTLRPGLARRLAFPLLFLGAGLVFVQPCSAGSDTFAATGSLTTGRDYHTATVLPSGKVLVAGGQGTSSYLTSAELYDPANGTWTSTGSLATKRRSPTATLLPNGKVLVAGGYNGAFLASGELYDPASGTWTATASLATTRANHTATLLSNGKLLVVGGVNSNAYVTSAELYDPASGTWTTTGSLATGRSAHAATLLPNGKVLVTGGYNGAFLVSGELYDPASGTWTGTGSLAAARNEHTATLLSNGKVLVAGGYGNAFPASGELYDPASGTWAATGSLATGRSAHTATLLPNGKVLVAGGSNGANPPYLASGELYDPASGSWTATGSLATARTTHTATLLPNGNVLVAGGFNNVSGNYLASVELYDDGQVTQPDSYTITTLAGLAGNTGSTDGSGSAARFWNPNGVARDSAGNAYVADTTNNTIRKITSGGVVTTLAGLAGASGSADGTGSAARFFSPRGVAVDGASNVYVADSGNQTIRKITAGGVVTTLAGIVGENGSDDGPGNASRFYSPNGLTVDSAGNVYVADASNYTIRKITSGGVVSTLAGLAGTHGKEDGTGSAAHFYFPEAVAADSAGNVYVADGFNNTIRKVTSGGVVTTLAGLGCTGPLTCNAGSVDGTGSAARFHFPTGISVDSAGNLYVADSVNRTIRKVTPGGVVTTLAGLAGVNGSDDGVGSAARFGNPTGVAVDSTGNVFYIADSGNFTIRTGTKASTTPVCAPPPSGLVSWWPGMENGNDQLGHNSGVLQNGVIFAPGKVTSAFSFDGSGASVNIPDAPSLNSTTATWEFWIQTTQAGQNAGIIAKHDQTGSTHGFTIFLKSTGQVVIQIKGNSSGTATEVTSTQTINDGQFHHIAATFESGATTVLFVDGVVSASAPTLTFTFNPTPLRFGRALDSFWASFHGVLDEVDFYNRVLTQSEVQSIFNAGSLGKCAGTAMPDLRLGMTAFTNISPNGSNVVAGDIITYTLSVYNAGTAAATGVIILDTVPPHTTFLGANYGGFVSGNHFIEFDLGTVPPSGPDNALALNIYLKADRDAAGASFTNRDAAVADGVPLVQGQDHISTTIQGPVNVDVSSSVSSVSPGGLLTYTFHVTNSYSDRTARNVQLFVPLPLEVQLVSFTGAGGSVNGENVIFNLGNLAPNASLTLTVTVQLPYDVTPTSSLVLGGVKLSADSGSGQTGFFTGVTTTPISGQVPSGAPELSLTKFVPDGVTIKQLLVEAVLTGNNQILTAFQSIFPGLNSDASIDALAQAINPDIADNTDANGNFVQGVIAPAQPTGPGSTFINFALIYGNRGSLAADNAFIQDQVPLGTQYVAGSATLNGAPIGANKLAVKDYGRTLIFTLGSAAPGYSLVTYKVRVLKQGEKDAIALGNNIQARGAFMGASSLFHTSYATPEEIDLALVAPANAFAESSKTTPNGGVGAIVAYEIFYQNTGGTVAHDLQIVDAVPAGTSFVRAAFLDPIAYCGNPKERCERGIDLSRNESINQPSAGATNGTVTYHLGPVPPGEFGFVRLQVKVEQSALSRDGLVYNNHATIPAASFSQLATSRSVSLPNGDPPDGNSVFFDLANAQNLSRVLGGNIPRLGIGLLTPMAVRAGDTFDYLVFLANPSNTDIGKADIAVLIPPGVEYVSSADETGPSGYFKGVVGTDSSGKPAVIFQAVVASDANQFINQIVHAHSSILRKVTFRASAASAGKTLVTSAHTQIADFPNAAGVAVAPVYSLNSSTYVYSADQSFESVRSQIVGSALATQGFDTSNLNSKPDFQAKVDALTPTSTQVVSGGLDNLSLNNGVLVVPLGQGNILAAGPSRTLGGSLVASGGGNVISNDGASLVASGGGNLIHLTNLVGNSGGTLVGNDGNYTSSGQPATLASVFSQLVASGGGNLVASGGGNLVASGGGNLISQDGGSLISNDGGSAKTIIPADLVASGGGNLVAAGAGNVISTNGSNLVASGGGNLVASGGGNIVATGGGNLVASGGGNLVASGGGNVISPDGASLVSAGAGNLVASGGGNLVASGGGNFHPAAPQQSIPAKPGSKNTKSAPAAIAPNRLASPMRQNNKPGNKPYNEE